MPPLWFFASQVPGHSPRHDHHLILHFRCPLIVSLSCCAHLSLFFERFLNEITTHSVPPAVNNAGIQYVSPVIDFPEDKWDDVVAVCLSSAFHASKAALPFMNKVWANAHLPRLHPHPSPASHPPPPSLGQQAGWGRIINTGSMHALVASPYKSAYNAAKHGKCSPLDHVHADP